MGREYSPPGSLLVAIALVEREQRPPRRHGNIPLERCRSEPFPFVVIVMAADGAADDERRRAMKYLLTLWGDESRYADRPPEQLQEDMKHWDAYTIETKVAGAFVGGEGLQPTATATTVEIQPSGDHIVTDGPFAETKEQLGGFYLLDCENLDDAIAWAKKVPMPGGKVEVRPVMDYEAAGSAQHGQEAGARR
jgi:hypothetical protein